MKKLISICILLFLTFSLRAQETPPTGVNFKNVPTYSFKYYTSDSTVWMYKGSTYGWTNLTKNSEILDSLGFYRMLNNHDSLAALQERSYHSLVDTPNLDMKANVDDPAFTTKITTPTLNITTGATENYYWKCTNASTGAGAWTSISAAEVYKGTWNANTNTPTLANGSGTAGWYYSCAVVGTTDFGAGNITFSIGDKAKYNGSIWQREPAVSQWTTSGNDIYYNVGNVELRAGNKLKLYNPANDAYAEQYVDASNDLYIKNGNDKTYFQSLTDFNFQSYSSGWVTRMSILADGSTGIKITPETTLDVNGTIRSRSGVQLYSAGYNNWLFTNNNADLKVYETGGSGAFYIRSGGNVESNGVISATGGNSTEWNTAYTHSQVAGGNSVHVSTDENTQWDAAYTHSQIAGGNSVHVSTDENTQWDAAYTHSTDNTQAHSDYLLNSGNDETSGSLTATNFILSSDRRLKENIKPIKMNVQGIEFVQFNLKSEPGQLRYGVIAQDVEKIAPDLIRTDESGMKSVAYIDLLIAKVAELEKRISELEKSNKGKRKRHEK